MFVIFGFFFPLHWVLIKEFFRPAPASLITFISLMTFSTFFYIFPDGNFYPRWTRLLVLGWFIVAAVILGLYLLSPSSSNQEILTPTITLAILAIGAYAQYDRLSHKVNPSHAIQIRGILYSILIVIFSWLLFFTTPILFPVLSQPSIARILFVIFGISLYYFSLGLVPAVILSTTMRYRPWDLDKLINQTLVYGFLSALLAGVYIASVTVLQIIFRTLTGQTSTVVIILSTLALAAVFSPLRRYLQESI